MARTTLSGLIEELRGLTEAGTAEYTLGTTVYWNDDALQNILDLHRKDLRFMQLQSYPDTVQGGSLEYKEYRSSYGFYEQTGGGTSIFYLQDSTGATLGTALWNADYRRGVFTFVNTTLGTSVYLTGRTYDMNAAAADVWRKKASHYAPSSFDFSTDNHRIDRSQVYDHALEMASYFEGMSGGAIQSTKMYRSDVY
jgi:hypothetical protein